MPSGIIVITGPTATGKTALGAALAKKFGGEVVSADSMQIYKGMDIGTAKPSPVEMMGVPHHMMDIVPPTENYSVARYVADASACIDGITARGKLPILVGGTGLYIESLLSGRSFAKKGDQELRAALSARYDAFGGEAMLKSLAAVDPESALKLHANDRKRIVRALEIYGATGKTLSEHNAETRLAAPRYASWRIALSYSDRADLYRAIDERVDGMMQRGLLEEVERLMKDGLTTEYTSMQAIGYKELAEAILNMSSVEEAVEKIKTESRRYAKRQLSWFRRDKDVKWILWGKKPDLDEGLLVSTKYLEECGYNKTV